MRSLFKEDRFPVFFIFSSYIDFCLHIKFLQMHTHFSGLKINDCLRLEPTSGGQLVQPLCSSWEIQSRAPRPMFRLLLKISKEETTTSMGNLYQCSVTCTLKKCFLMFKREPNVPVCGPGTTHHCKIPSSIFFAACLHVFIHANKD